MAPIIADAEPARCPWLAIAKAIALGLSKPIDVMNAKKQSISSGRESNCNTAELNPRREATKGIQITCFNTFSGPYRVARFALIDRKSTRLNSSHVRISYAVFC